MCIVGWSSHLCYHQRTESVLIAWAALFVDCFSMEPDICETLILSYFFVIISENIG